METAPREGEGFEQLLRRFKMEVERSGVLKELRRKRFFRPNSVVRREKQRAALRRQRKNRGRDRGRG